MAMHHELRPLDHADSLGQRAVDPLPWEVDPTHLRRVVAELERSSASVGGDVASYWLPYVPIVLDELRPDSRFVVLRRNRAEVIESFMRKAPTKNHWIIHDGTEYELAPKWDRSFPKYHLATKEEALGAYWDEYDARSRQLEDRYPGRVRVWDYSDVLNSKEGVLQLLDFIGLDPDRRRIEVGVNRNRSRRRIGQYLRMWRRRNAGT